jgi:hypothetical protein
MLILPCSSTIFVYVPSVLSLGFMYILRYPLLQAGGLSMVGSVIHLQLPNRIAQQIVQSPVAEVFSHFSPLAILNYDHKYD